MVRTRLFSLNFITSGVGKSRFLMIVAVSGFFLVDESSITFTGALSGFSFVFATGLLFPVFGVVVLTVLLLLFVTAFVFGLVTGGFFTAAVVVFFGVVVFLTTGGDFF